MNCLMLERTFLLFSCIFIFETFFVSGCASVPQFTPSQKIEQAASLTEGLLLCNEYRMPLPAERLVALKPFLNCLDELNEIFNPAGTHIIFNTFQAEMFKRYSLIDEWEWSPHLGIEYEIAIHAIERRISLGESYSGIFTPTEQELAQRFFPKTARLLDAKNWKTSSSAQFDPELEKLYAEIAPLLSQESNLLFQVSIPIEPSPLQIQNENQCNKLRKLNGELGQLASLWKDLKIFSRITPEGDPSFKRSLARYQNLMAEAKEKLKQFKSIQKLQHPYNLCYKGSSRGALVSHDSKS
jgi:hypothetical protein